MERRLWTREEEIVVFNLYCKIPFNKSSKLHPEIIKIAKFMPCKEFLEYHTDIIFENWKR